MRVLMFVLGWLPLPLLQGLGAMAAWGIRVTNGNRWRVALHNLERCMPELGDDERRRIARTSLRTELTTYLETARYWLGPGWAVRRSVREWRNIGVLEDAFAQGRGVILLTLHMGAFEAVRGRVPAGSVVRAVRMARSGVRRAEQTALGRV